MAEKDLPDLAKVYLKHDMDTKDLMYLHSTVLAWFDSIKNYIDGLKDVRLSLKAKLMLDLTSLLTDFESDFLMTYKEVQKRLIEYNEHQEQNILGFITNYVPPYIGDPYAIFERLEKIKKEGKTDLYDAISEFIVSMLKLPTSPDTIKSILERLFPPKEGQKGGSGEGGNKPS
jgi:hypothetical protein